MVFIDGFIVTFDGPALDDCQYKYAYYQVGTLGDKKVDRALSVALMPRASGETLGVVVDKAVNGPGGQCSSNGSIDIND